MRLMYPLFSEPIKFAEGEHNVLIIENPTELQKFISELVNQVEGYDGNIVLSKDFKIIDIKKNVELIINPFNISFDTRRISNKLLQLIFSTVNEHDEEIQTAVQLMNNIGFNIISGIPYNVAFKEFETSEDIIKCINFKIDTRSLSFAEAIVEYVKIQKELLNKKLFVFVNLKMYLSGVELAEFYKMIEYIDCSVLLVEGNATESISNAEIIRLIDQDLCELS